MCIVSTPQLRKGSKQVPDSPKSFIPSPICINKRNHAYAAVQVAESVKLVLFFHGFDAVCRLIMAGSFQAYPS